MDTMSAADIAAVTGRGDGFGFGNEGLWLFAILALMGGGFGNWGGREGNAVTEADLCNANSFNDLKSAVRGISDQVNGMNVGLTKGLCDFGYTTLSQFNAMERQLADCCCQNQLATQSVKFDMANYAAGTNQLIQSGIQSVKDMFRDYHEADLRDQNMRQYIQSQFCGVVRYPNSIAYTAGNPFFGCGNGCCTNI